MIFQDTPNLGLLFALMPLLSHDMYEVEFESVDTFNVIKTKTNVLEGWPAVIFAQAIDYTHYKQVVQYEGKYIAIVDSQIVASAETSGEVMKLVVQ